MRHSGTRWSTVDVTDFDVETLHGWGVCVGWLPRTDETS